MLFYFIALYLCYKITIMYKGNYTQLHTPIIYYEIK